MIGTSIKFLDPCERSTRSLTSRRASVVISSISSSMLIPYAAAVEDLELNSVVDSAPNGFDMASSEVLALSANMFVAFLDVIYLKKPKYKKENFENCNLRVEDKKIINFFCLFQIHKHTEKKRN